MKTIKKRKVIKKQLFKLNVFFKPIKKKSMKEMYYSKSQSFKAIFNNMQFINVNFRGAIFTSCSFNFASFDGVEFWGTNLKKSQFKNSRFTDCVFVGSKLDRANFKKAKFTNCIFVNMNYSTVKNLSIDTQQNIKLNKYPNLILSDELKKIIINTKTNKNISRYKLLFLNDKKFNMLNILLLLKHFSESDLIRGLLFALENVNVDIPTVKSLIKFIRQNK